MKQTRLTQTALDQVREIALWTIHRFGVQQAETYERRLFDMVDQLAEGERTGRSCSDLAPSHANAASLYYVRAGQHFVVYRETEDEIVIVGFIHGARDLPGILRSLDVREA